MNGIKTNEGKRQIVVFDSIVSTYPGGVHIDATDAKARFTNGIIPAGTVVVPSTDGKVKVLNATLSATNVKGAIGLVEGDVKIEDFTLASVVMSGTARKDALPELEKAGVSFLSAELKRISFI